MNSNFERVLRLVKQTGDNVVIFDRSEDSAFVVMDLSEYEAMLGLEDELGWVAKDESFTEQPIASPEVKSGGVDVWDVMQSPDSSNGTWDPQNLNEAELDELERQYKEFTNRHVQEIVKNESNNDDSLAEKADEVDDFGEESFYLEPVE